MDFFSWVDRFKWQAISTSGSPSGPQPKGVDGRILVLVAKGKKASLEFLDKPTRALVQNAMERFGFTPEPGEVLCFDEALQCRIVIGFIPEPQQMFFMLELARKLVTPLLEAQCKRIHVDLRGVPEQLVIEALFSAVGTCWAFQGKSYQKAPKKTPPLAEWFVTSGKPLDQSRVTDALEQSAATNCVRWLITQPGNELTPSEYVRLAKQLGKGLKQEFFDLNRLSKMGAGAFVAVAQGAQDRAAGILKLSYSPTKPAGRLALVGKGITFDTGGAQLKTGDSMFGMHADMGGSAVALALTLLAHRQKWPWAVDCYLAIAENVLGPKSYRPNDVLSTLKGTTVEVVDTDAEGRLVLSDTLWLASQAKPQVMLDFATLTGACVRAVGTSYSGAYTNKTDWTPLIIEAGRTSGERVWPFPNDTDYGRALKSDIADIKQCRLSGGSDHIEAGHFLSQFVAPGIKWVHLDLSSVEREEGLAHVPTKFTGFGVRFGVELIRRVMR